MQPASQIAHFDDLHWVKIFEFSQPANPGKIQTMRISHAAFLLTMAATSCLGQAPPASGSSTPSQPAPSQTAPGNTAANPNAASAPARNAGPRPSAVLQP